MTKPRRQGYLAVKLYLAGTSAHPLRRNARGALKKGAKARSVTGQKGVVMVDENFAPMVRLDLKTASREAFADTVRSFNEQAAAQPKAPLPFTHDG